VAVAGEAAERGYVDLVIDPAETGPTVARCFSLLRTERETCSAAGTAAARCDWAASVARDASE